MIYDLIIFLVLNMLGLLFMLMVADRYWGTKFLGNLISPRSPLIYEGRQWWMKNIALMTVAGVFQSSLLVATSWLLMPYDLNRMLSLFVSSWSVILILITILGVCEKRERNRETATTQ